MNDENNDPILWLAGGDPAMRGAIAKARETFPEFVRELELEARRAVPALDAAIVKAFFFDFETPERGEHMFVDEVWVDGDTVHGVLSGTPQSVTSVSEGDEVSFPILLISDWFLVADGRGRGGYTLDVIAKQMSPETYRASVSHPPFSWFAWRQKAE